MLTKKVQSWLGSPGAPAPQISLAAFGKHPGWDDHIEDLGLDTDALVQARRVLYSEGIGGNIESGAWDKLEEPQRLAGFGHVVLWRRGWDLLIAVLWSSSDGKGRTRYPMVLCAHCRSVPMTWAVSEVLPRLQKAHERCVEARTADEVREIVQATRLKLRTALTASMQTIGSWHGDDVVADRELVRLAESSQLQSLTSPTGPRREGLLRVLYQIEREMGAFRPSPSNRKSAMVNARPQQIRVPSCGIAPGEAGRTWTGVLLESLADGVGIMTIQAFDQRWLDVIVGEPASSNLFCVRASEKAVPLTSDVPYTLDADFIARCEAMIGAWGGAAAPAPVKPKTAPLAAPPLPTYTDAGRTDHPRVSNPNIKWYALAVVILVLVIIALVVIMRGGTGATPPRPPVRSTEAPGVPAPISIAARPQPAAEPADVDPPASGPAAGPSTLAVASAPDAKPDVVGSDAVAPAAPIEQAVVPTIHEPDVQAQDQGKPATSGSTNAPTVTPGVAKPLPPTADSKAAAVPAPVPPAAPAPVRAPAPSASRGPTVGGGTASVRPGAVKVTTVARAIRLGYALDEPIAAGAPTLADAAAALDLSAADAVDVLAAVATLKQIAALQDRAGLVTQAQSAAGPTAFAGFAAWRRLVDLGWPATSAEIKDFPAVRVHVLALAETVDDGVRRPELRAALMSQARAAARRGLEVAGASTDDELAQALKAAEAAGLARADLGPVATFNAQLLDFRAEFIRAVSGPAKPTDQAAGALVEGFVAQAQRLPASVRDRADVRAMLTRLSSLLEQAQAVKPQPPQDLAGRGPGAVGWRPEPSADGSTLTYFLEIPGRPAERIEFVRVPTAGPALFLSREEVGVGLVIRTLARHGRWSDLRDCRLLRVFDPTRHDPRAGPRCWDWAMSRSGESRPGEIQVAGQWLAGSASSTSYAPGIDPPAPSADSPFQHASVDAMVYIARLLGCRLPTSAEWRQAAQMERAAAFANRRDARWAEQWEFAAAGKDKAAAPPWPDRGAFRPREAGAIGIEDRARPAFAEDDGWLWFAPVNLDPTGPAARRAGVGSGPAGPAAIFRHLTGNVAEVVFEEPAKLETLDPDHPETIDAVLADRAAVRVIGGSALSAPEVLVDTPYKVERTPSREGWADVGFRLAFSARDAGAPPLWMSARGAVDALTYVAEP